MAFTANVVEQVSALKRTPLVISLTVFYTSISVLCFVYLIITLVGNPFDDADAGNASWSGAWSVAALVDFYVAALCMCGIILMTQGLVAGIMWSTLILALGSPILCLYMFNVFRWYGGFALVSKVIYQRPSGTSAPNLEGTLGMGYIILGIAIIVRFVWSCAQYPFFPIETQSDTWAWEWFLTLIANFYAAALCICGVIISSQHGFTSSIWCLCTLILGAPVCCMYMAFRLLKYGSIALACHPDAAKEMGEDVPPILRRTSSKAFAPSEPSPHVVPPLPDRRSSSKQSSTDGVTHQPSKDSKETQQFGIRASGGGDIARVSSKSIHRPSSPRPAGGAADQVPDLPQRTASKQSSSSVTRVPSKESNQPRTSASSRQSSKEFGQTWSRRSEGESRRTPWTPNGGLRTGQPSKEWNGEARASPRVLVHAPASSRSASKEAAYESALAATAARGGPAVASAAHEVEANEMTGEDRADAI